MRTYDNISVNRYIFSVFGQCFYVYYLISLLQRSHERCKQNAVLSVDFLAWKFAKIVSFHIPNRNIFAVASKTFSQITNNKKKKNQIDKI